VTRELLMPSYRLNYAISGVHLLLNAFVLAGFPLLLLPDPGMAMLLVVAVSCTSNALFSVLHEAIHRSLAPVARLPLIGLSTNDLLGRTLGIAFGSPFDFIGTAHVTHHSVNRTHDEHVEIYDSSLSMAERGSVVKSYYFFLLGGLYKAELLVPMAFWLPRRVAESRLASVFQGDPMVSQALRRIFRSPHLLRAIRLDASLIVVSIAASAWLYGRYAWILAIHFLIRAFLISFLDYLYHYASPLGDRLHGYNLRLPRWVSALLLHFNYHGIHHRFPALPWRALPKVFDDERLGFDHSYMSQALSQLKGPMTRETLEELLGRTEIAADVRLSRPCVRRPQAGALK
jgi:fatty acid desaturase